LDLHDISIHIPIEWEYYPGSPATYHDPEEHETVEFFQEEALEHIHDSFKRMEVVGNEYA
jgi:hypothetical protein